MIYISGNIQITGTCRGTFDSRENEITTPRYPSLYPNGRQCNWNIEATEGKLIELEFAAFNLEDHFYCEYDWLQIYDGGSLSSPPLTKKLCGTRNPNISVSTGNALFLKWVSDRSHTYSGFKISASLKGEQNL